MELLDKKLLQSYRHEKDSDVSKKLYESTLFQKANQYMIDYHLEDIYNYIHKSSLIKISKDMSKEIHSLLESACQLFEVEEIPELYLTRDYYSDIELFGFEHPYIVISSDYLNRLDKKMLFGVLASQVAGIKANHHKTLFLIWVIEFVSRFIPGMGLVANVMTNQWKRYRFFTYDRAFLLATGNYECTLKYLIIGELSNDTLSTIDLPTLERMLSHQLKEFNNENKAVKSYHTLFKEQEWLPERYDEIKKFNRTVLNQ